MWNVLTLHKLPLLSYFQFQCLSYYNACQLNFIRLHDSRMFSYVSFVYGVCILTILEVKTTLKFIMFILSCSHHFHLSFISFKYTFGDNLFIN